MKKLGIVLSGGGIRGLAHVGLLQVLRENGIEFDCITGTSAGALVGALYAAGRSTEEMIEAFEATPIFSFENYTWIKPGLINTVKLRTFLKKYIPEDSFEELARELHITSTDLEHGQLAVHNTGKLYRPLLASMSLPPFFSPVKIDGVLHSDGGIMDNFPVGIIRNRCDVVIGSHVCPINQKQSKDFKTTFGVWWRAYELNIHAASMAKFNLCDYVFEPIELCSLGFMDQKAVRQAYEIGYEAASLQIDALLTAIHGKTAKKVVMTNAA